MDFEKNYDYSLLPPHIITSILLYLKSQDLKRAIQTCWSFYDASLHPWLHRKLLIRFEHTSFSSTNENQFLTILETPRFFTKIVFSYVSFSSFFEKFWTKFGGNIRDIEFNNCKIDRLHMAKILGHLQNLKTFKFESLNFESFFGSRRGQETPFDKTDDYERCLASISNLKSISITGPCCSNLFYQMFGHLKNLEDFHYNDFPAGHNGLDFNTIIKVLENNRATIKSLSLNIAASVHDFGPKINTLLKKIHLKKLQLTNRLVDRLDFNEISGSELEHLSFSCLEEEQLISICSNCPKLKILEMKRFRGGNSFVRLQVLEVLRFYQNCFNLTLFSEPKLSLRILYVNGVIDTSYLEIISENAPNLEELFLLGLKGNSMKEFQSVFKNCTKLKKLIICVSDVEDETDEIFDDDRYTISNLKNLTVFKMNGSMTGISLGRLNKFPNLEVLDVTREMNATADEIQDLVNDCLCIEELSFYGVDALTDNLLGYVRDNLHNLRILNVYGCKNVSDANNTVYTKRIF